MTSDSESNSTEVYEKDSNILSSDLLIDLNSSEGNDLLIEALDDNNISDDQINQQIMEIERSVKSDNGCDDISDEVYQKVADLELSVIPINRPLSHQMPDQFNDREMQILNELLNAVQIIRQPITKITTEIQNVFELRRTMSYKYDREIKNLVKTSKSLRAFNCLCEGDRIALLKDHCLAVLLMRSVMCYNYETKYWTIFMVSVCPLE